MPYCFNVASGLASSKSKGDRTMKRFLIVVALTCALSSTAVAGNIPTGDIAPPPPPPDETTITGDIPSVGFTSPSDMPAVDLLLTVLGLVF
jgi:hypothetical protein